MNVDLTNRRVFCCILQCLCAIEAKKKKKMSAQIVKRELVKGKGKEVLGEGPVDMSPP